MGRIRSIKPDLPQDEKLGSVCRDSRLLFVLLLTIADDYGRFRAKPMYLKGQLFPYDDGDIQPLVTAAQVADWLEELASAGRVLLYEIEGQSYGAFRNWKRHQRIDNAGKSAIPEPPQVAAIRREPPRTAAGCGKDKEEEKERNQPNTVTVITAREKELGAGDCAFIVAQQLRITNDEVIEAMRKQLILLVQHSPGMTFMAAGNIMLQNTRDYIAAKDRLKYEWGWKTFFGGNYWSDPMRWPWKDANGNRAQERQAGNLDAARAAIASIEGLDREGSNGSRGVVEGACDSRIAPALRGAPGGHIAPKAGSGVPSDTRDEKTHRGLSDYRGHTGEGNGD